MTIQKAHIVFVTPEAKTDVVGFATHRNAPQMFVFATAQRGLFHRGMALEGIEFEPSGVEKDSVSADGNSYTRVFGKLEGFTEAHAPVNPGLSTLNADLIAKLRAAAI